MQQTDFEQLVIDAIDALPEAGKKAMRNVAFFVEPKVRTAKANEVHITRDELLLGLYEGISLAERGDSYFGALPDKITIFQEPIEELAEGDSEKLKELVFDVVRHEVGHHLGFNEHDIREYDAAHARK
ncbi:MAG: metallopeptidase family protein [Candidatus Pacebacteria bacterium]|jgi:predicted Zn-dependent protease with MMP-like domain|nr:metallopeptidase family protein [Candidatus Paceibacterota bacterium]